MAEPVSSLPATPDGQPSDVSEQPTVPPSDDLAEASTLQPGFGSVVESAGPAPDAIPGYTIEKEIGRGGMGVVYQARQKPPLNRTVALKMILAGEFADNAARQRFLGEAEAIAKLHHPHIVQVFDFGTHAGNPYFALEFVSGGNLAQKLAGTPQDPKAAATLVEKLARAMQVAHDKGIIHRDLKPGNVLLTETGEPKITDFGLAKQVTDQPAAQADGLTATGAIMGTPSYMAPEQAGGSKTIGPAADVYALGAILYDCLTGRPPFKAATPLDTVLQVISDDPVSPRQLQSKVPRDLETICLKCLQKDPTKRYAGAQALADDLHRFLQGDPIQARPVTTLERGLKWVKRRPALATLAASVILLVVLFLILWFEDSVKILQQRNQVQNLLNEQTTANTKLEATVSDLNSANTKLADALNLAKTNEEKANDRADAAMAAVEQFEVANGLRELDSGQFYQAMCWFALPLRGEGALTKRASLHQNRLSNYWRVPEDASATGHILCQSLRGIL